MPPLNWDHMLDTPIDYSRDGTAKYSDDASLYVEFVLHAEYREKESEAAGRPIFVEVPHFKAVLPGGKDTAFRPVREDDKLRFPRQWANFEAGQAGALVGTPISEWPLPGAGERAVLNSLGIKTVEQLAAASDDTLAKIGMGARKLQDGARKFLDVASSTGLQSENERLQNEIAELKRQFAEFQPRKRRSRPAAITEEIEEDGNND